MATGFRTLKTRVLWVRWQSGWMPWAEATDTQGGLSATEALVLVQKFYGGFQFKALYWDSSKFRILLAGRKPKETHAT